jgi:UDP-N-acetylmuramoylalanine--D-glutamate ligase
MGLGINRGGLGVACFLIRAGARVTVTDLAPAPFLRPSLATLGHGRAALVLGRHRAEDFINARLVVRVPSIRDDNPFIRLARESGARIIQELDLFLSECPTRNLIAVTGSKGKSTTTRLIAEILRADGRDVVVAGNSIDSTLAHLDNLTPSSWVVLELSSFQLHWMPDGLVQPRVAVLTSLFHDHVAWHGTYADYVTDKARIFRSQAPSNLAIVCRGSDEADDTARSVPGRVERFDETTLPSDWRLTMLGDHQRANAAAAWLACREVGVDDDVARRAIEAFPGLSGRCRLVATVNGVRYFDDSLAQIAEATVAAFRTVGPRVIWVTGGTERGLNAAAIQAVGHRYLKAVVLIPSNDESLIRAAVGSTPVFHASDIEEATLMAAGMAQSGDSVLMSIPFGPFPLPSGDVYVRRIRVGASMAGAFERAIRRLQSADIR